MAEERTNDSFPELREVENKIGRKTPESLLIWMRDAADCGERWRSDVGDDEDQSSVLSSDGFSDKISSLELEMRWLRSADVRILRQLVAVHESIEAMRWLMEERGGFISRGSSLTDSLSSLVTLEEHGPSGSPCRGSPSPTCPHTVDSYSDHKSYCDVLSPEFTEARPPSPSSIKFEASGSTHGSYDPAPSNPANGLVSASLQKSQPQDLDIDALKDMKAGTIRRALFRSTKSRKKVYSASFIEPQESRETHVEHSVPQESFKTYQSKALEEEESAPVGENFLLGYDAQWYWVESQDDVTFL